MAKSKKPVAKKSSPTTGPASKPSFDTSLAAETAARMIGAKAHGTLAGSAEPDASRKETSLFKQMKETMAKPHAASVDALLNNTVSPGTRRSALPFGSDKQVGHNQTVGSSVSRRNLPRRTGG
jgi:hypothetical protein